MLELKLSKADDAMDWLTFISSVVGSIAWPIAAFAIAFLFRSQLRTLLDRIRKLSVGDKSVDFGELLGEAEADVVTALPTAAPEPASLSLPDPRTAQLIALSPSAAVVDAWRAVEKDVRDRAHPLALNYSKTATMRLPLAFRFAARLLLDAGRITSSTFALLLDLQGLRNAAAHGEEISPAEAIRFTTLAKQALFFLEGPDVRPDSPDV